jgi:putative CocE/NonD family hydrolase
MPGLLSGGVELDTAPLSGRVRLVARVAAIVAALHGIQGEAAGEAGARWNVPEFLTHESATPLRPRWVRRLTGYLTARDGTLLRYSVLLPARSGRFPVIINYSGYDPGAIGGAAYLHDNTTMSTDVDATLLEHGYAILGINARGTGCSEGTFDFLGPSYGTDGADAVEWAASQPWSTGAIGMANWSWAGMSQIATASEQPPHLKAIAPGMAMTDPRLDSWAIGGVPSQGFVTGWWMFLHSRWLAVRHSAELENDGRCLQQVEKNYEAGETAAVNLPSQLVRHALRDDWIETRTILRKSNRIEVPVLSMEAFQDEATTSRAGYYQEGLNPQRLWYVQTNGNHDLYESHQFQSLLVRFMDHFLKGRDNGFEREPRVQIWQEAASEAGLLGAQRDRMARPRWTVLRSTYPVATVTKAFSLGPQHVLVADADGPDFPSLPSAAFDSYQYPVPGPSVDTDTDAPSWGPMAADWKNGSLAFTSAALAHSLLIYGALSADLWVSSSASDTDLQVTLTEVRPDGQERFVQRGWLRASDRAQDPARSTSTRPWPCDLPQCIQALSPGEPVLLRVELSKVSYAFRPSSRIRLWIDAPSAQGHNVFDHSSIPSTNSIWFDAQHASRLVMPVLEGVEVPEVPSACDAVLMQPCRPDPIEH